MRALIASAVLFLISAPPALAEESPAIMTNQNVDALLGKGQSLLPMIELRGFVGPSDSGVIRLYWDLSLTRYWEIPRSAVARSIPGKDPDNDPIRIFVPATTLVSITSAMPAEGVVVQRALLEGGFNNLLTGGPTIPVNTTNNTNLFGGSPVLANNAVHGGAVGYLQGQAWSCIAGMVIGCLAMEAAGLTTTYLLSTQ